MSRLWYVCRAIMTDCRRIKGMTRVDCSVILNVLKISQLVQELNRGMRQTSG